MHANLAHKAVALLAALAAVDASPIASSSLERRDVLSPLPENAEAIAKKFQPVLDFDTDSCYNTAAIDKNGNTNPGLQKDNTGVAENCRRVSRLDNSNTYSRVRCNNGWCAIMYEYYFEKDVATSNVPFSDGHRHEWENVIVWVKDGKVRKVAPSCHGEYVGSKLVAPLLDGTHPKIVYHKDGGGTHCFRIAGEADNDIENVKGVWFSSPLVGWNGWPSVSLRQKMISTWPEDIFPRLENKFGETLKEAQRDVAANFDPFRDG